MITEFIGRFHPVFVHLPIGIFVIVVAMEFMGRTKRFSHLLFSINFMLLIGVITGVFSLVTGYLLSLNDSNESTAVSQHKWVAIFTVVMYLGYYFLRQFIIDKKGIQTTILILLLFMITITGHLGGTITHGEGYLTSGLNKKVEKNIIPTAAKLENIQDAKLYEDVVLHTMTQKCVQCHGADRQKGMLRLDGKEWILKGGKNGAVIDIKSPENSEILKRIQLAQNDEHHMPPKDKDQLSDEELVLLKWWLVGGAEFDKKVALIKKDSKIEAALKSFHQKIKSEATTEVVRETVNAISSETKLKLEQAGWVLSPLSATENYVRVVGFNLQIPLNEALKELTQIKNQVAELKLSFKNISDTNIVVLKDFKNLEKLWLDHTLITDKSLPSINGFSKLTYLNLSNTAVTAKGLSLLNPNSMIEKIYVFNSGIQKNELTSISKTMTHTSIVTASDSMEFVPSDTLFIKK